MSLVVIWIWCLLSLSYSSKIVKVPQIFQSCRACDQGCTAETCYAWRINVENKLPIQRSGKINKPSWHSKVSYELRMWTLAFSCSNETRRWVLVLVVEMKETGITCEPASQTGPGNARELYCSQFTSQAKHPGPIQLNLRQAGQEASIKAVNVVPTIGLRRSPIAWQSPRQLSRSH